MVRKLVFLLVLSLPLVAAVSCGAPEVDVPENPTPPPSSAPTTTTMSQPDQDG